MHNMTRNGELKQYAIGKGVRLWQVAERFGCSDVTLCRRLRKEFPKADSDRFKACVDEIAKENEGGGQ